MASFGNSSFVAQSILQLRDLANPCKQMIVIAKFPLSYTFQQEWLTISQTLSEVGFVGPAHFFVHEVICLRMCQFIDATEMQTFLATLHAAYRTLHVPEKRSPMLFPK